MELKESIDRGYVLIKFTNTRGGTELGVRLDDAASDLSHADFEQSTVCLLFIGTKFAGHQTGAQAVVATWVAAND